MNRLALALKLARREMRSGLAGFRIFLASLVLGVAAIAGVGSLSQAFLTGIAEQGRVLLGGDVSVRLVHRDQGLIIPSGNPRGVTGLADLASGALSYVNRQRGAGTRMLLDQELRRLGIDPGTVHGYEREEPTHLAVAAAVAAGRADCGLGILAAARAFGLDFVPMVQEPYDLVVDMNANGILDGGDLIDGRGDDGGFSVVKDLVAPGPLAVTTVNITITLTGVGAAPARLSYPTNIAALGRRPVRIFHDWLMKDVLVEAA